MLKNKLQIKAEETVTTKKVSMALVKFQGAEEV